MADRITKEDLASSLQQETSMSENEASEFVQKFFELIGRTLEEERYVKIKGLGTFKLISVDSRRSVNINTGENIEIPSHHKVSFTAEAALKELINKPFSHFEAVELKEELSLDILPDEQQDGVADETEFTVEEEPNGRVEEPSELGDSVMEQPCDVEEQADEDRQKGRFAFGIIVALTLFVILAGMLFLFAPEFLENLIYD